MTAIRTTDYYLEVARGNVPGVQNGFIVGANPSIGTANTESITDMGGNYVYLTANTQLYISSSSASDTDVDVLLSGLDDDHNPIALTVNTNGHTQEAFSLATSYRIFSVVVTGSISPVGDLYIAEADTLTLGVPDTETKVKAKIPLNTMAGEPAEFASDNISHLGLYTVPAGKTFYGLNVNAFTEKNIDVMFSGRVRLFGGVWLNRSPSPIYQANVEQPFENRLSLPEKTDLEFRAVAGNPGSKFQFQFQFILVDNDS